MQTSEKRFRVENNLFLSIRRTTSVNSKSTDDIGKFTNDHDSKHVGRHAPGINVGQSAFGRQH
ncbi:hypothetical protein, partial [Sutterella wadsworthensis]|uniref:hypothetical protein n=1 Tax=Sutterella wadsworthensis TaxID=40545 RepID=UPI003967017C